MKERIKKHGDLLFALGLVIFFILIVVLFAYLKNTPVEPETLPFPGYCDLLPINFC